MKKPCELCKLKLARSQRRFCSNECWREFCKIENIKPPSRKGVRLSDEEKRAISVRLTGRKWDHPHPQKGVARSEEIKKKISLKHRGKKLSKEHIEKMRAYKIANGKRGKEHHWWKGGKTVAKDLFRSSWEYEKWRRDVFRRDDYMCQMCGKRGGTLNADHIKPFSIYPELRLSLENGRTLCRECHKKTDTYLWRIYKHPIYSVLLLKT